MHSDDTRTDQRLLERSADFQDHSAWKELVARYDPYIKSWCFEYKIDVDMADDLRQEFWVELADKMRSFRYDPSRRFRGWLRRRFHWRAIDLIRSRGLEVKAFQFLDDTPEISRMFSSVDSNEFGMEGDEGRLALVALGREVQETVRAKVHPRSWEAFWHLSIDGWTARETADLLEMKILAVHAANRRVLQRLLLEGSRRLDEMVSKGIDPRLSRP